MVTITMTQQTYDDLLECLRQAPEPVEVAPIFIENALRRRLRYEASIHRLAAKENLSEEEAMELATAAVQFARDCRPK